MRLLSGVIAGAAALVTATPAAAQPQDRLSVVGQWVARFAEATSGPNAAAASCAPQFQAAISRAHTPASARASIAAIKPCSDRIRAAYSSSIVKLDALEPLPPGVATGSFSSAKVVAEQRRLAEENIAQVDRINRLLEAVVANNAKALPGLAADVRRGGATLIDSNILMFRLQKDSAVFQSSRVIADLRILLAEAGKALVVAPVSATGIGAGPRLAELSVRSRDLAPQLLSGWSSDKARLMPAAGEPAEPMIARVVAKADPLISGIAEDGQKLTTVLAKAGAKPVLSLAEATRLATDLQSIELQLQTRAKAFGAALVSEN